MKPNRNTRALLNSLAYAVALSIGLSAGSASAQTIIEIGGAGTIGDDTLTTNVVPIGGTNWTVEGDVGFVYSGLISPNATVTATGAVTLTFDHRYFIETAWDGSAVFVSVNGGAFTYLPLSAFSANGYAGDTLANTPNSAWEGGEDVFYGKSAGYDTPVLIQSVANLGVLTAGDTVAVEFRGGWDGGFNEAGTDWEIGAVKLTDAGAVDILDADFTANGASDFTVANSGTGSISNPWNYLKPKSRFEINGDLLTADRYAPNAPGDVINLNGADIQVALFAGTLDPGDSFTIFNLSGGTTLTGSIGNLSLPAGNWDTSALETTGTITFISPSAAMSQLGVLDLAANGGINPNTGTAWAVGDQYRIAFYTDGTTQTTANDPNFYRDFVTAQAWANPALQGAYFVPMITLNTNPFTADENPSTTFLTVKEFTGTSDLTGGTGVGGAGGPVYVVDGQTCIARNNADIWNGWSNPFAADTTVRTGGVHYSPYLTQNGAQIVNPDANHGATIATGCNSSGATVRPLGTSADFNPFDISTGSSNPNNSGRAWNRFGSSATSNNRLYAISVPLTVFDGNEVVLPTLTPSDIVDGQGGADAILNVAPIVYTVTFSEVIDGSTLEITDFGNAGTATFTIDSIRGTLDPTAFEVTVTPTSTGTVQLKVNAAAVIADLAGNALDTTLAITDDTTITVIEDITAPTVTSINDNAGGGPILINSTLTYTVTFDESMDFATVDISDFGNGGSAGVTIDSVSYFGDPTVFEVTVSTNATPGDLTLEILAGADIKDFVGNPLDTSSAVPDDTTIAVNLPVATAASIGVDFQATIASEQHPTYGGEARYYHVSVNPANAGTGSYAATIVGTDDPAPAFVRNYGGDVLSYKFPGGTNNDITSVAMSGGDDSLITYTTEDFIYDGFNQQQAKVWDATDPGADLATGGGNPYNAAADKNAGGYRSLGGAVGTVDISGLASGSLHIYYGSFGATPTLKVTLRDTDNIAADLVIADAHSIADGGNGDASNRSEYYLAEIDFVTDGFYDVIVYEWLANGTNYQGNGRGLGTVLTGPEPVTDYAAWSEQFAPADLSDPGADFDGDGLTNNEERLFGLDPTDPASQNPISVGLDNGAGTFTFTRRDDALTGLYTNIEYSFDLQIWMQDSGAVLVQGPVDGSGVESVAVTLSPSLLTNPNLFTRVNQNSGIIFSEDFEADDGGFTTPGAPNDWAHGAPMSDNGFDLAVGAGNGATTGAWGTNLGDGTVPSGVINTAATSVLRSPDIDLTGVAGGATLSFAAAIDAQQNDVVQVIVRDAGDDSAIATFDIVDTSTGIVTAEWTAYGPLDISAAAGSTVYLEFTFAGSDAQFIGLYIDDVVINQTP
jgi:hypothetical protein